MKKMIVGSLLVIIMFGTVGALEYAAPTENQVWDVRCTHPDRIVSYVSPQRVSLRDEIRMCK